MFSPYKLTEMVKSKKQIILDDPVKSGKIIALAMLVHLARDQGWLVLYAPKGL